MSGSTADANVQYSRDNPNDCKFCYYWQGRKKGCLMGDRTAPISSERKNRRSAASMMAVHTEDIRPALAGVP